ncbi:unnamed protein product [Gongylonema pulchrum]|uniref:GIPC1-3 GH1 domain-containing protein n=1 Tax=Gongylonema pulchrum TaxID=637853 RepID=A0A183F128_9BILA|nr:unnamed protein product [Gongylonema pulchrum]
MSPSLQAIADCYDDVSADDILFCTINMHRICMGALLSSKISINDYIFAHVTGQKKLPSHCLRVNSKVFF